MLDAAKGGLRVATCNGKSLLKLTGIPKAEPLFDCIVAAYLIDPLKSDWKYDDGASGYLQKAVKSEEELIGKKGPGAFVKAEPDKDYVLWIAPALGQTEFSATDVIVTECSTDPLSSGGSVSVTMGTEVCKPSDITVPLTAEGAEMIFYIWETKNNVTKYPDDETKAARLFAKGKAVEATEITAALTDLKGITIASIAPETPYVLFTLAVDETGKYGPVQTKEYSTSAIQYNNMTVRLEETANEPGNVQVKISVEGGTPDGYLYWVGKSTSATWTSSTAMGGSLEKAQQYMFLNSELYEFTKIAAKYPVVDGVITMTDLELSKDYILVVMAKDGEGMYSKANMLAFTTNAYAPKITKNLKSTYTGNITNATII